MKTGIVRVLLVEDNLDAARIICEELKGVHSDSFKLECVGKLSRVLQRIDKGDIDVILLDLSLPDSQGFETFARVHTHLPDIPIIVLSGNRDELLAVKTVQAGAKDYLIKGEWDIGSMVHSIYYAMGRQKTISIFTN